MMKLQHLIFLIICSLPLTASECQPTADALGPCGPKEVVNGDKVLYSKTDKLYLETGQSNKDCHVDVEITCHYAGLRAFTDSTEPPVTIWVVPTNVFVQDWPLTKKRELIFAFDDYFYQWKYTVSNGSKNISPAYVIVGANIALNDNAVQGDSVSTSIEMRYKKL